MAAKALTKAQLVTKLAGELKMTKVTVSQFLDHLNYLAVAETKKSGQFTLPGFGKLVKSNRKARMGRNPQTGAAIKIPAKTVVKFRVAKACKEAIIPPKK
jgi:DNA-binding protein HU-beta